MQSGGRGVAFSRLPGPVLLSPALDLLRDAMFVNVRGCDEIPSLSHSLGPSALSELPGDLRGTGLARFASSYGRAHRRLWPLISMAPSRATWLRAYSLAWKQTMS